MSGLCIERFKQRLLGLLEQGTGALLVGLTVLVLSAPGSAWAATCTAADPDGDGDGFCASQDCNDADPSINPGATDLCGDGIDSNCDGLDFTDASWPGLEPGDNCQLFSGPADECVTTSVGAKSGGPDGLVCTSAASMACETPINGILEWEAETLALPGGYGTCNDGVDNDCDGDIDSFGSGTAAADSDCSFAQEAFCDGLDEDQDGTADEDFSYSDALNNSVPLGGACVAGLGECAATGTVLCSLDQAGTRCDAIAASPGNEGLAFPGSCNDGLDNDCDGTADLADADCDGYAEPELCVGEGLPCKVGVGACEASGINVCTGGVVSCNALPLPPGPEEATAELCTDGVDNDCDGVADGQDLACVDGGFAEKPDLGVFCSLPYDTRGQPGSDCTGKHDVVFGATYPGVEVRADLVALDSEFNELNVIENVLQGATAHLASRVDSSDWKWATKSNKNRTVYETFAPQPVLRVTGTLGSGPTAIRQEAYCAIRPYLDLTQPSGQTLSLSSDGDEAIDVFVQLPLVDVQTLRIVVDGVTLTDGSVLDPQTQFPADLLCDAPGSCVFVVESGCGDPMMSAVEVRDLRVRGLAGDDVASVKEGISEPDQVNTLSFRLVGLPPGGHIVHVDAEPLSDLGTLSAECNVDELADSGTMSAFGITISAPSDQATNVAPGIDTIDGNVCGGNEIAALSINGAPIDVSGQVCDPGTPPDQAPECYLDFSAPIVETNLSDAIAGNAAVGTFKRGSNRVIADATDVLGTRAQNTDVIFAIGPVQSPPPAAGSLTSAPALVATAAARMAQAVSPSLGQVQAAMAANLENAFIVGLEEDGASAFFNEQCAGALATFTTQATNALQGKDFGDVDIKPGCSCDLNNVPVVLEQLDFENLDPATACVADFVDGQVNVKVNLPDVSIRIGAQDSCRDNGLFGECIARTTLDVEATISLVNLEFNFAITEEGILTGDSSATPEPTFLWQMTDGDGNTSRIDANNNGYVDDGEPENPAFDPVTKENVDIDCWGAELCQVGQFIAAAFIEVFTLGFADGFEIVDFLDFDWTTNPDFLNELQASEPDPMSLDEIKMDPDTVAEFGHAQYQSMISEVQIVGVEGPNPSDGLLVAFSAEVTNQSPEDPDIDESPGAVVENPPVPGVDQVVNPQDIAIMVSTDIFGQVFAAEKDAGLLTNQCISVDKTVGDLLPADCESLGVPEGTPEGDPADPDDFTGATIQGICHAIRGDDCALLDNLNGGGLEATERGVCHGFVGNNCNDLPLLERIACNSTPPLNIADSDALLICTQADLEPDLVFNTSAEDDTVPVSLLLNDLSVALALDRGGDGYSGSLQDLYATNCFDADNNGAGDCMVYAACLDLTVKARMGIDNSQCAPGLTGFVFDLVEPGGIIATGRDGSGQPNYGQICSAVTGGVNDDSTITQLTGESEEVFDLVKAAEQLTPPFCAEGLTLGNVVNFTTEDAKVFAISTDGDDIAEYLGLGGSLGAP